MTDFQLLRNKSKSLPYLSQWANVEAACPTRKFCHTDHWSKMKHKAMYVEICGNNGTSHSFFGESLPHEKKRKSRLLKHRHEIGGSMCNIGVKSFSDWIIQELNGKIPGDYSKVREPNPNILRTAANDRARDQFRYWFIEKKPSTYAKWMGMRGSTLGLAGQWNCQTENSLESWGPTRKAKERSLDFAFYDIILYIATADAAICFRTRDESGRLLEGDIVQKLVFLSTVDLEESRGSKTELHNPSASRIVLE